MAKQKSARPIATPRGVDAEDVPVVGGREPCPCGSGRRYKACHGRAASHADTHLVERPFAGLAGEADWVALREIVPAATASLRPVGEWAGRSVTLATVLPLAWPALVRTDGEVYVGLQVRGGSGDASRDVAAALVRALEAEPGTPIEPAGLPGPGPRLQDLLDPDAPFEVTVRDGFDFWIEGIDDIDSETRGSMERANAAVVPTDRLTSVEAAYVARLPERSHLRWVLTEPEDSLLDAFARMRVAGDLGLGEETKYIGAFRAARAGGAGVGPADRGHRRGDGRAGSGLAWPAGCCAPGRRTAERRGAPRAQRTRQSAAHPALIAPAPQSTVTGSLSALSPSPRKGRPVSLDANVVQYIALGAAVAAVLALLLAVVATLRLRKMRRTYTVLQGDGGSDSFVEIVARKSAQVDDLREDVTQVHQRLDAVQASLADAISHIAVVRYDAFSDMGGRMSFSVAMLDDIGDGLVLTSINGRTETRTYAKGVKAGASEASLSPEEEQVVGWAMRDVKRNA